VVVDAQHRPLVSSYKFFVHVRHPAYRLVVKADEPLPPATRESEWKLTRRRDASDVNAEVRDAVERDGYSLFKIGLSLSEIPRA
jgi:hypothetical protein